MRFDKTYKNIPAVSDDLLRVAWKCINIWLVIYLFILYLSLDRNIKSEYLQEELRGNQILLNKNRH